MPISGPDHVLLAPDERVSTQIEALLMIMFIPESFSRFLPMWFFPQINEVHSSSEPSHFKHRVKIWKLF